MSVADCAKVVCKKQGYPLSEGKGRISVVPSPLVVSLLHDVVQGPNPSRGVRVPDVKESVRCVWSTVPSATRYYVGVVR